MIRWLWKIIVGKPQCNRNCDWQIEKSVRLHSAADQNCTTGFFFVQKCKTCGLLRNHEATW